MNESGSPVLFLPGTNPYKDQCYCIKFQLLIQDMPKNLACPGSELSSYYVGKQVAPVVLTALM